MSRTTHRVATTQGSAIIPDFLSKVSSKVVNFVSRSQAERQLQALDDRLLSDIGLKSPDICKMEWGPPLHRGACPKLWSRRSSRRRADVRQNMGWMPPSRRSQRAKKVVTDPIKRGEGIHGQ